MIILFWTNQGGATPDVTALDTNRAFIDFVFIDGQSPWTDETYITPATGPWTDYTEPVSALPWTDVKRTDYGMYNQPGITYATQVFIEYNDFVGDI